MSTEAEEFLGIAKDDNGANSTGAWGLRVQRKIYVAGVLLWVLYGLFFPTWVGRSYNFDIGPGGGPRLAGGFGLRGGNGVYKVAPIWSPPTAHSDVIHPSVCWPWQQPSQQDHVELAVARVIARWSVGILFLGFIFRGLNWINPSEKPDALLSIAWSLSLALVIAWLCIFVSNVITMFGPSEAVGVGILLFGAIVGLIYGIGTHWRRCSIFQAKHLDDELPANQTAVGNRNDDASRQVPQVGAGLLWFTFGIFAGLFITLAEVFIALFFRGPIVGRSDWGTPNYLYETLAIRAAGLTILATGWTLGIYLLRRRPYRGFALGLIVATTVLGSMLTGFLGLFR